MIQNVQQFVVQYVNHQDAIHLAKNQKMQFVMLNVKSQIAQLCALIKHAKQKIAQNVWQYAKLHTALLIANLQNQLAKQFAKNQNAIGNAKSQSALSQNAS